MIETTWKQKTRQRLNAEFWDDQVVESLLDFVVEQNLTVEFNTFADELLADYETKELSNDND